MARLRVLSASPLHSMFYYRNELRSGFKVLIFAAVVGIVGAGVYLLRRPLHLPRPMTPGFFLRSEVFALAIVLAATCIMARLEGRKLWAYGLAAPDAAAKFCHGWIAGVLSITALIGCLVVSGHLAGFTISQGGTEVFAYGAVWLLAFAVQSLTEETLFRGYVMATLARGMGFWPASILISCLFGLTHLPNRGENLLGALTTVVAALMFCLLLRTSQSLWMGAGFHAAWNWGESFLYGTADSGLVIQGHLLSMHGQGRALISGGADGPEGSLLAAPALIVGALALRRAVLQNKHVLF